MHVGYYFGLGKVYGISAFEVDEIDFEQGSWELFSLDIADTRGSLGFLNCYLSAF